jgi:hypothetical protein
MTTLNPVLMGVDATVPARATAADDADAADANDTYWR